MPSNIQDNLKDAPIKIWLHTCDDVGCKTSFHEHDDKTWSDNNADGNGVEYVRADKLPSAEIERLQAIAFSANALVKAKGRYHTEQNFKALAALFV